MSSKKKKPMNTSATSKSQFRMLLQRSKTQQHVGRSFTQDNSVSGSKISTRKNESTTLENDDGFLFKRFSAGRSFSDNPSKISESKNPIELSKASRKYEHSNESISKERASNSKKGVAKTKSAKLAKSGTKIKRSSSNPSNLLDINSDSDDHLDNSIFKTEKAQNGKEKIIKSRKKLRDLAIQLTEINGSKQDNESDLIKPLEKPKSKSKKKVQSSKPSSSKRRHSSIIPEKEELKKSELSPKESRILNSEDSESKRVPATKKRTKISRKSNNSDVNLNSPAEIEEASHIKNSSKLNQSVNPGNKISHSVNWGQKKVGSSAKIGSIPDQASKGIKQPLKLSPVKRPKMITNNRRSSLGNRGKRTSSVGNGFQVSPHDNIPSLNFYKHLNQDLPEPHRMRQLLAWCLKRQLDDDKKNDDSSNRRSKLFNNEELIAKNIATVIKEEILRDLVDGKINTSWWNREDYDGDVDKQVKKKRKILPNSQNEENLNTLKILEKHLSRLKKEKNDLDKLSEKYKFELKVSHVLDSNSNDSENFVKSHIEKSILRKGKKEYSTVENAEKNFYNSFIKEQENVNNLNKASQLMSDIKSDYIESLKKLNNFADQLNYNEAVAKNFQYIKNRQLSTVIKNYINNSFIDKDIKVTDNINHGFKNIDILKGISRIDKS